MVIIQVLVSIVFFLIGFKVLEMLITPFVIAIIGAIYIPCGKRNEFNAMIEKYKERKFRGGKSFEFSKKSNTTSSSGHSVNPNTCRPMISGTSTDVGGRAFGTGRF
jgi:hypothetical protein